MANEQYIRNRRGTLLTTVIPGKTKNVSTLVLHGYGAPEYGQLRDNNLVFLLENFYNSTAPENPIEGQLWWQTNKELFVWTLQGSPEGGTWDNIVPPTDALGFNVIAGGGLTGGGFPTTSPAEVVLNVGAGTGVTVGSPTGFITIKESEINHDALSGFVANEHINHSTLTITAGAGLSGGGVLTGSLNFDIGAGDGIIVNANDVSVDNTVLMVGSPNQTTTGNYIVSGSQIRGDNETNPATSVAYTFINDTTTGMMKTGSDQLAFVYGGKARITIRSDGVMRAGSPYPIAADDDIPTKAYVDALAGSGTSPTENTFIGSSTLTGLTAGKIYQVNIYGKIPDHGTLGTSSLSTITLRSGTTLGAGTVLPAPTNIGGSPVFQSGTAFTNAISINWFDGDGVVNTTFIVKALSTSLNCQVNNSIYGGSNAYSTYMTAVELGDG